MKIRRVTIEWEDGSTYTMDRKEWIERLNNFVLKSFHEEVEDLDWTGNREQSR